MSNKTTMKINFFNEYQELTSDIITSDHQFFVDNLQRWFDTLDEYTDVSYIINRIEEIIDFDSWLQKYATTKQQFGCSTINWPDGRTARLGAQIALFRAFARRDVEAFQFAYQFTQSDTTNINQTLRDFVSQVFSPMATDLRRYIDRNWTAAAPDADIVVPLDHSSLPYSEAAEALARVEETIRSANDYDDVEEKEQRIAEISAGRRLLEAMRIRPEALKKAVGVALIALMTKFKDNAISAVAKLAWNKLAALFGSYWLGS